MPNFPWEINNLSYFSSLLKKLNKKWWQTSGYLKPPEKNNRLGHSHHPLCYPFDSPLTHWIGVTGCDVCQMRGHARCPSAIWIMDSVLWNIGHAMGHVTSPLWDMYDRKRQRGRRPAFMYGKKEYTHMSACIRGRWYEGILYELQHRSTRQQLPVKNLNKPKYCSSCFQLWGFM